MRLELRVLNERVTVEAAQPEGDLRLDQALPFLRAVDDAAVGVAVKHTEATGQTISCHKGCAHCCKGQPVPVTPAEAFALARLVERLPEPRRQQILARFEEAGHRLRTAGLASAYTHRDSSLTQERARDIARQYFHLHLGCPFLDDDACGIYADRPFVCRQYLVTSDPELCRDPFVNPVAVVPMPIRAATAALKTATQFLGRPQFTVPLVLALDYAEKHRAELEQAFPAEPLFRTSVQAIGA